MACKMDLWKKYENDNQTAGIVFHKSKSKQPTTWKTIHRNENDNLGSSNIRKSRTSYNSFWMLSKKEEKRILIFTEYKNVIKTIDEFHKFTRKKGKNRDVIWKIIEIKTQCELDEKIIQFKHITSNTKNKKKAEKKRKK
jgi:hypothetical protein